MSLKNNYKDDILDESKNVRRKYEMVSNADGTVSFIDRTVYTQQGDTFGAGDMNAITECVNKTLEIVSFDESTGVLTTRTME